MTDILEQDAAPQKTVHGIFSLIYTAFHEAGKLCKDESLDGSTMALRAALDALPQSDIDALVQNVTTVYKALDSMHVCGISFSPDMENKMVLSTSTVQFGDRKVDMPAPFNEEAAAAILKQMQSSLLAIKPSPLILPN